MKKLLSFILPFLLLVVFFSYKNQSLAQTVSASDCNNPTGPWDCKVIATGDSIHNGWVVSVGLSTYAQECTLAFNSTFNNYQCTVIFQNVPLNVALAVSNTSASYVSGPPVVGSGSTFGCTGFGDCLSTLSTPGLTGFDSATLPTKIVGIFLPIALSLAGFIAAIFIVISGIQFIISSGDPESAAKARGRLTFAIIGFVLIILAFALTQIINTVFLKTNVF